MAEKDLLDTHCLNQTIFKVLKTCLKGIFKIFCNTFRSNTTSPSLYYTVLSSVDGLCHSISIKLSVSSADGRDSESRSLDEGRVAQCQSGNQLLVRRFIQRAEAVIGIFLTYTIHTVHAFSLKLNVGIVFTALCSCFNTIRHLNIWLS